MKILHVCLTLFFITLICSIAYAELSEPGAAGEGIRIVSPAENIEIADKKPEVRVDFTVPIKLDTLMVQLDGADITPLLEVTDKGFIYKPFMVVSAGTHQLRISATDTEGKQLQKEISFSTRHSKKFEEAFVQNDLSVAYENAFIKPDTASATPASKIEGNLRSDTKIKNKEWQATFNTNLRYLDQSLPVLSPQKKGIDIANWTLTGAYAKEALRFQTSIGDIQINETPYTVTGLARRGGQISMENDNYKLNLFGVKSQQVLGFYGGTGIDFNNDEHILGVSGSLKLFDKKVEAKLIYATGGDPPNSLSTPSTAPTIAACNPTGIPSFPVSDNSTPCNPQINPSCQVSGPGAPCNPLGLSSPGAGGKGDVLGIFVSSDFFQNKLKTELEADFNRFNTDPSDEFGSKSDKAYRLKAGGIIDKYNYEAMYEHIGRDYAVVGNQMLQKDKEGISLRGGANIEAHALNLMFSRYHDNVTGNELYPRIVNYQGSADYSCTKFPQVPIGIAWQTSVQQSTREPSGATPVDLHTNTLTGRLGYMAGKFSLNFQTAYSLIDDMTPSNNDTQTTTYTLTPSFNDPNVSVSSNLMLNESKSILTNVLTDTYSINLDLRTKFLNEKGAFDVSGTYSINKADNGSTDTRNLNTNFKLAYSIKNLLKGLLNPTVALRGTYLNVRDKINQTSNRDEFILFLMLSTSTPFSL